MRLKNIKKSVDEKKEIELALGKAEEERKATIKKSENEKKEIKLALGKAEEERKATIKKLEKKMKQTFSLVKENAKTECQQEIDRLKDQAEQEYKKYITESDNLKSSISLYETEIKSLNEKLKSLSYDANKREDQSPLQRESSNINRGANTATDNNIRQRFAEIMG